MTGALPLQQRNVKPYAYVVKAGDTVSSISKSFTGEASRWPELVGANLHLPLSQGAVGGTPFRVFADMTEGQRLRVPAEWPEPREFEMRGAVGIPISAFKPGGTTTTQTATVDMFSQFVTQVNPYLTALGTQLPQGYSQNDVLAVAWNWLPYITQYMPLSVPPTVSPTSFPWDIGNPKFIPFISSLLASAIAFLQANPIAPQSLPGVLSSIPWDVVPWAKIPWQAMSEQLVPAQRGEAFRLLFGEKKRLLSSHIKSNASKMSPIGPPAFLNAKTWTSQPMSGAAAFGLTEVPWTELPADWQSDAELLVCLQTHPERLKDITANKPCFIYNTSKAKKYLCDTTQTIASICASTTTPNPCPTGQYPNPLAQNACQSPLPCKTGETFDPTKWACVAGAGEKKEDKNNMPLYVGLGVAGIALVAGIVVLTARD